MQLQLCRWKSPHKEIMQQTFVDRSWNLPRKIAKSRFGRPFGKLGVTYTVHLWLVEKPVVDVLLALIERFSLAFTVERLWANINRNCAVWKGNGSLWVQISGKGSSTNDFWREKTRLPGLSRGVVCVILRLAVLIQYRRVTHRHTHTHTYTHIHDDGYYPRIACTTRVKIASELTRIVKEQIPTVKYTGYSLK